MRDILLYVKDILECIERIEEYVGDIDYEQFTQASKTFDAVIRRLEIIGEASKIHSKGYQREIQRNSLETNSWDEKQNNSCLFWY